MLRLPSVSMFVVLVAFAGQRVVAQSPLVYSHYVPRPNVELTAIAGYLDIPGSEHTLTVPAGTAFITWSLRGDVSCTAGTCIDTTRFRPVIGNSFPTEGLPDDDSGTSSGSWAIPVEAGSIMVKFQIAAPFALGQYESQFTMFSSESWNKDWMSWTLIVFPDAVAGVPAVGGIGLLVLVAALLGVAALVIAHRSKASPV